MTIDEFCREANIKAENHHPNYRPLDRVLDGEKHAAAANDCLALPAEALQAAAHTAIQQPIDSAAQILCPQFLPNLQIVDAPAEAAPLSARWHAQQIGAAAGAAADIIGLEILSRGTLPPAAAGAIYDGLLRPVDSTKQNDQLYERAKNAAIGGLTFGTLGAASKAIGAIARESENATIKSLGENQMLRDSIAGIPAGLVGSALSGAHTVKDFAMGAYTSAFTGMGLGAIHATIARRNERDVADLRRRVEVSELKEDVQALRKEALSDHLTGLGNRRGMDEALQTEFEKAERTGKPLSMIYGDLDGFKAVNDNLGHAAGDRVLKHVADQLKNHMRTYDYAGRVGGDEFAIVLPETSAHMAQQLAARLEKAVKMELVDGNKVHKVGISLGVVTHNAGDTARHAVDESTYKTMLDKSLADFRKRADQEMYRIKGERKALI